MDSHNHGRIIDILGDSASWFLVVFDTQSIAMLPSNVIIGYMPRYHCGTSNKSRTNASFIRMPTISAQAAAAAAAEAGARNRRKKGQQKNATRG